MFVVTALSLLSSLLLGWCSTVAVVEGAFFFASTFFSVFFAAALTSSVAFFDAAAALFLASFATSFFAFVAALAAFFSAFFAFVAAFFSAFLATFLSFLAFAAAFTAFLFLSLTAFFAAVASCLLIDVDAATAARLTFSMISFACFQTALSAPPFFPAIAVTAASICLMYAAASSPRLIAAAASEPAFFTFFTTLSPALEESGSFPVLTSSEAAIRAWIFLRRRAFFSFARFVASSTSVFISSFMAAFFLLASSSSFLAFAAAIFSLTVSGFAGFASGGLRIPFFSIAATTLAADGFLFFLFALDLARSASYAFWALSMVVPFGAPFVFATATLAAR